MFPLFSIVSDDVDRAAVCLSGAWSVRSIKNSFFRVRAARGRGEIERRSKEGGRVPAANNNFAVDKHCTGLPDNRKVP